MTSLFNTATIPNPQHNGNQESDGVIIDIREWKISSLLNTLKIFLKCVGGSYKQKSVTQESYKIKWYTLRGTQNKGNMVIRTAASGQDEVFMETKRSQANYKNAFLKVLESCQSKKSQEN